MELGCLLHNSFVMLQETLLFGNFSILPFKFFCSFYVLGLSNVHLDRKSEDGGEGTVIVSMMKMGFAQS